MVYEAVRRPPQRRGFVHLDDDGERTITILGDRLVPHRRRSAAVGRARRDRRRLRDRRRRGRDRRRPPRALARGHAARGGDAPRGRRPRGRAHPLGQGRARTAGGRAPTRCRGSSSRRWAATAAAGAASWARGTLAEPLPGPRVDAYGGGDSFAAAFTTGLAVGLPIDEALRLGARCGAACDGPRAVHRTARPPRDGAARSRPCRARAERSPRRRRAQRRTGDVPGGPGARARRGSVPSRAGGRRRGRGGGAARARRPGAGCRRPPGPGVGGGLSPGPPPGPSSRPSSSSSSRSRKNHMSQTISAPTSKTRRPTMKIQPWSVIPRRRLRPSGPLV